MVWIASRPTEPVGQRPYRGASWLAVLVLAACGAPGAAESAPSSHPSAVALEVSAAAPTREGRVVWAWLEEEDFRSYREGSFSDALLVRLLEALEVSEPLTLGPDPIPVGRVSIRRPGGFVVAFQPPGGEVWDTLRGRPYDGAAYALSSTVRPSSGHDLPREIVELVPENGPSSPLEETCRGPRRELLRLEVPEVAGEIGNDPSRRFCVVLPESYEASAVRRYPVVYLLPEYGGSDTTYLNLADPDPGVILVGVDGRTRFGTTYFYDTAYAGAWMVLLARAVSEIDRRFRTVADPRARGLLGHSTGGFNAISLALRRTDLFGAAAASSPDALDLDSWTFLHAHARSPFRQWTRLDAQLGGAGRIVSYAVQFDDASHPGAIVWPFDLRTGARDGAVWARWRRANPLAMLEEPAVIERARNHLSGRLFVSVGRRDAFGLFEPAERFHQRLVELEIDHAWVPTEGGHFEGSDERRAAGLAFLVERLR